MSARVVQSVSNAIWQNPEHTMLECDVQYEGEGSTVLTSVHDSENIPYRIDIWDMAVTQGGISEYVPPTIDLNEEKAWRKNSIDEVAGEVRRKFITSAPGQEMTYQEKAEQAADYVAASYPADTSNYPFIQAEINATGKTKEQAADDILTQRAAWIAVGATIEEHRLAGKKQVDEATTVEDIKTITDNTIALLEAVS